MFDKFKEDVDLYLIIVIATVTLVLDIFNLVNIDLVATVILAVMSLLSFSLIKNRDNDKSLKKKISYFSSEPSIKESGLVGVLPKMNYELFDSKIKFANKEIIIMQTWLNAMEPVSEELKEAIKRGIKVKILLLKQDSDLAKRRNDDLGYGYSSQRSQALYTGVISSLLKVQSENLELRVHEFIPPFSLYCVDDWMIAGYYWHSRGSLTNPMFEIEGSQKNTLGWNYKHTFTEMWNKSEIIVIDKLNK